MKIVLLAVPASANVRLKQFQKVISMLLILISVQTAVLVLMYVPQKQSIRRKLNTQKTKKIL